MPSPTAPITYWDLVPILGVNHAVKYPPITPPEYNIAEASIVAKGPANFNASRM